MTSDQERLIAALTAEPETGDDGGYLTFNEIAAKLQWSENRLRAMMRQLAAEGRLDCKRIPRRSIAGDVQRVPGYKLADTPVKST